VNTNDATWCRKRNSGMPSKTFKNPSRSERARPQLILCDVTKSSCGATPAVPDVGVRKTKHGKPCRSGKTEKPSTLFQSRRVLLKNFETFFVSGIRRSKRLRNERTINLWFLSRVSCETFSNTTRRKTTKTGYSDDYYLSFIFFYRNLT